MTACRQKEAIEHTVAYNITRCQEILIFRIALIYPSHIIFSYVTFQVNKGYSYSALGIIYIYIYVTIYIYIQSYLFQNQNQPWRTKYYIFLLQLSWHCMAVQPWFPIHNLTLFLCSLQEDILFLILLGPANSRSKPPIQQWAINKYFQNLFYYIIHLSLVCFMIETLLCLHCYFLSFVLCLQWDFLSFVHDVYSNLIDLYSSLL